MKLFSLLICVLLTNCIFGQQRFVIQTKNYIPEYDTVEYYIPKTSAEVKKFPAVILLHGYGGNYSQWGKICDLQQLSDNYKMVLICPDGFKESWYIDSPIRLRLKYATFFKQELLPEIFRKLPVDSSLMFITGLSMGGHGALYLFSLNSEVFRAAGSISGVVDLRASSVTKSITKVLGVKSTQNDNWDKYSLINRIDILKQSGKPLIINCGSQDFLIEANRKFAKKCAEEKLDVCYMESPGKHNKDYWRLLLPEQLRFFRKFVGK